MDYDDYLGLHSMAPSHDGKTTYLAYSRGGFGILDTSKVAKNQIPTGLVENLNDDLLTPVPFPNWGRDPSCTLENIPFGCAEAHSALPLPGRPFVYTSDEVYGTLYTTQFSLLAPQGWPWGWAKMWNVANPSKPKLTSEYQIYQNTSAFTPSEPENVLTSYSPHNPTATRNLIFATWHSGGLQAIDVSNPGNPRQVGWFSPTPLGAVANEDPYLRGPNKVTMWSYPIIKDGLIYVVDLRNGLYVLRYTGPKADREVGEVSFLEGSSNIGDAGRLNHSAAQPKAGDDD